LAGENVGTEGRARATPKQGAAGRKGSQQEREAKLNADVEIPRLELSVWVHSDVLLTADYREAGGQR
jgi:hypothetical protein